MLISNPLNKFKKILYKKDINKNVTEICPFSLSLLFINLFAFNFFV
jgi:hypothetical protein